MSNFILTCSLSVRSLATELKKCFLISRDFFFFLVSCPMPNAVLGARDTMVNQAGTEYLGTRVHCGWNTDRGDKYQEMRMEMSV